MNKVKTSLIIALVLLLVALVLWIGRSHNKEVQLNPFTPESTAQAIEKASVPPDRIIHPLTPPQKRALDRLSATSTEVFGDTKEEQEILKLLES